MKSILAQYGIGVAVFLAIDYVWLRTMGPTFYANELGPLLREQPDLKVALAFYLLYVAGLVFIVIHPAVQSGALGPAVLKGAVFGLVAYGTYDMTNLATIKGFTARVAVVDMMWGTFLSATVTGLTLVLVRVLKLS